MPYRAAEWKAEPARRVPIQLLTLLAFVVMAVGAVAYSYHLDQKRAIEREVRNQLLSVADMKVSQISEWLTERIADADAVMANYMTPQVIRRYMERGSPEDRDAILRWLAALSARRTYSNALLADRQGRIVLAVGQSMGDAEHIGELVDEVVRSRKLLLRDFRRDHSSGQAHLGLTIPLSTKPGAEPIAALLLAIDPGDYLYPLLKRWPVPSQTAETLLVRRDGGDVLFLNDLKYRANAALNLRFPLTTEQLPAAMAARGFEGTVEGVDYRGIPVFAAVRGVPGTAWFLVAKMDASEVQAPVTWRSAMMGIAALGLIAAAVAGVALLWRRQQVRFYRDRYRAEVERRALAGHYDYLSRFANDIILLMDEAGRLVEANDKAVDCYGYSRDELLSMNIRDLRHPSAVASFEREWKEALTRGALLFETMHRRRDGSAMPVEVSSRTIEVDGQQFRQSIIRDITERLNAQTALRQSGERLRTVVENAPEGIMVERDCAILYINPVAANLLGACEPSGLLGRSLFDFVVPEEHTRVRERSALVAQGRAVPPQERQFVRLDGEILTAEVSAVPIEYDQRAASLMFFRDVRERRRTEAERAALEAQLRQAQKMESIGRLAGGVAHDFNNHLTVINGYCDMMLGEIGDGHPFHEPLEEIHLAGERAAALTQQLLAFSRKQIAELKPIRLNDVVTEAGRMLRRLIGEDIEIVTRLDPGGAVVLADRGQMNQVLMNLALNARDAMPDGGRLLIETSTAIVDEAYVELHPDATPGYFSTLSVSDTGEGMDKETLQRIFEPFFTTKKTGAGTGLGLATVYGIVRQGGGWIRVYSEPQRGTLFQIYLPAAEAPAAGITPAAPGEAALGSETVLVVEDQAEVRKLTLTILQQHGYRLLGATDAAEALAICDRHPEPIDLLITDVVMPGMNGRELATRLAAARPALKVLYMSGYTADVIGHQGILDPGVAYLPKPFTVADLTNKVREVLGPHRPAMIGFSRTEGEPCNAPSTYPQTGASAGSTSALPRKPALER